MFTETDMLLRVACCLPAIRHLMFSWSRYGAGDESSLGSWIQRSGPSATRLSIQEDGAFSSEEEHPVLLCCRAMSPDEHTRNDRQGK